MAAFGVVEHLDVVEHLGACGGLGGIDSPPDPLAFEHRPKKLSTGASRVIVDSTLQEKVIAHPTDNRLLEVARGKLVLLCKRHGLKPRQSHEREGPKLSLRAGRSHAKQFKRMRRVLRRQCTVLGCVIRDMGRKLHTLEDASQQRIQVWLERAERIWRQQRKEKQKLYALHAPEVECIGKGKARRPYEFGVKVGIVEREAEGIWRVHDDHAEQGRQYDAQRLGGGVAVELTSHLPIERQARVVGAIWLDQQLIAGARVWATWALGLR